MSGRGAERGYSGRRVLVLGLGMSGVAAATFLSSKGARVRGNDSRAAERLTPEARALEEHGVELVLGGHPSSALDGIDLVVVSPGVPLGNELIRIAAGRNVPIWGELELGARACRGRIVAVTGTKGKSTTATLIERGLAAGGASVSLSGNIGVPFVEVASRSLDGDIVVVEASSFQLASIDTFCPEVAVLLDVSPDHLDWHPSFDHYVRSKKRIFENQGPEQWSVVYGGSDLTLSMASDSKARVVAFGLARPPSSLERCVFRDGEEVVLEDAQTGERAVLASLDTATLRGDHNFLNYIAACSALHVLGVDRDAIEGAARGFEGLPHAIEWVARIRGVDFYNDSKATQMVAVAAALESFERRRIHLILGGRAKGGDFRDLRLLVRDVKEIYALGESVDLIDRAFADIRPVRRGETLEAIVERAFGDAREGDVVLLSPGGSSFDLFDNYRHRGEEFRRIVLSLKRLHGNDADVGKESDGE